MSRLIGGICHTDRVRLGGGGVGGVGLEGVESGPISTCLQARLCLEK